MIDNIYNFLTGGIFTNLKELIENCIEWVITFITNTTYKFFEPFINLVLSSLPVIDDLSGKVQYVFNFISPYVSYILDLVFLSKPILSYLFLSLAFRVIIKLSTYVSKLILKWYKALAP